MSDYFDHPLMLLMPLLLRCFSSEELKERGSPDIERGDFYAIQQLVDYLPNGKLIKLEVNAQSLSFDFNIG